MSADWFCKIGEKRIGPLNGQQLKTFAAQGQLKPEHLVRRGSEGPWVPAGRIKGLFVGGTPGEGPPHNTKPPSTAEPLPKAVKSATSPRTQASPLPSASQSPPPPPIDIPAELSLGGQEKHHVPLNVDKFNIETTPVMVSQRKMKSGLQSMKKADQQKATVILLSVIGGGTIIGLIVFIWAAASGMLSGPKQPEPATVATLPGAPTAPSATPPAASGQAKPEAEKRPVPRPAQATWPTNFKTVFLENATVGDFHLTVLKPLRGAPPKGVKTDDKEVLIVPVNVWLKEDAKKNAEFVGWDDATIKDDVSLTDDKDGKGNRFVFQGQVFREGEDAKAVAKQRIQVRLVFELPAPIPKAMYLALPAAAFRVEGPMIGYTFSPSEIGGEASK